MKTIARCIVAAALAAAPLTALAQQNYTAVSAYRVTKLRILPGKTKDFYKTMDYSVKIWEAEKAAGLILDYKLFAPTGYEGADKYDLMFSIHIKNMAAFDTFADQAEPIVAKAYGTPENRAALAKLRAESGEVVSSELIRDITLKPPM